METQQAGVQPASALNSSPSHYVLGFCAFLSIGSMLLAYAMATIGRDPGARARQFLEAQGLHDVTSIGARPSGCPSGYGSFGFSARTERGERVSGAVCTMGSDVFVALDR